MKITSTSTLPLSSIMVLIFLLCCQCNPQKDNTYESLLSYANQVIVINTHEHQHWPEEFGDLHYRFPHLLRASYLMSDVVSAGASWMNWDGIDSLSMEEYWDLFGQGLDYSRNTSYYSHFVKGFQILYDFEDLFFTESNVKDLSAQIESNYADYRTWFDQAFFQAGFELMFLDQYWNPFNTDVEEAYYALVFHINPLVMDVSRKPANQEDSRGVFSEALEDGHSIASLDDYLVFCEKLFKRNLEKQAVCVKNSLAYSRSLDFEDVSYEKARELFARVSSTLTQQEEKMLQDFMFHWIIQKSIEHDLPIQIHTGYLAGNGNTLDNGKPVKLNKLFLKYREAKFVLFHGGYPWTGEYAAFGKMFPNVYLDLVWLPQISREEAVHALDEMLDGVPYNKFFWGGDCAFIEESTGSLEFGKEVVAEVLAKRIERGYLTRELAEEMIHSIFRENAIRVFKLEQKLGRTF